MAVEINYKITLNSDTIISQKANSTNEIDTEDYIPGSVVRAIFADHFKNYVNDFILNENIYFLNAYIEIKNNYSMPIPLSFYREKNSPELKTIYDKIILNKRIDFELKQANHCYITKLNNTIYYKKVQTRTIVNNYVINQNIFEEKDIERKAIYTLNTLVKNQSFLGKIIIINDDKNEEFFKEMKRINEIKIGKARTAGYGKAKIEILGKSEFKFNNKRTSNNNTYIFTLLSDLILIDNNLNYCSNITKDNLTNALNLSGIKKPVKSINEIYKSSKNIDGFNLIHSLPKRIITVIEKGSVFKVEFEQELNEDEIKEIELKGIGLKTNEGFGRIGINLDIHSEDEIKIQESNDEEKENNQIKWFDINLPESWEKSVFLKQIEIKIIQKVEEIIDKNKDELIKHKIPSNSQIQGLRNAIFDAQNKEEFIKFIDNKNGKSAVKKGEWDIRINEKNMLEFLKELCDEQNFFKYIGLNEIKANMKTKYHLIGLKRFISLLVQRIIKDRKKMEVENK